MTDNEIIKALECCVNADCENCPSKTICDSDTERLVVKVFDLVNRQKAEIERLQSMNQAKLDMIHDLRAEIADEKAKGDMCAEVIKRQDKEIARLERIRAELSKEIDDYKEIVFMDRSEAIKKLKAEAVKEFAFMLKAMAAGRLAWDEYDEEICGFLAVDEIDNLVKEFTERKET